MITRASLKAREAQDKRLSNDLAALTAKAKGAYAALVALVLGGGYGRGEGSWYRDDKGRWHPYNDYDVFVIADRALGKTNRRKLEVDLAQQLGITVDLIEYSKPQLQELKLSIKSLDLKYASQVFYGDERILDEIPDFEANKIPLKEVETLYFTRLQTFGGGLSSGAWRRGVSGEQSRFFRNQMAKAVLAGVDAILVESGEYDPSYRTRVERLSGFKHLKSQEIERAKWALAEKLNPRDDPLDPEKLVCLYRDSYGFFEKNMFRVLGRFYGGNIESAADLVRLKQNGWRGIIRRLYWFVRDRNLEIERANIVFHVQALLVDYLGKRWRDDHLLQEGARLLQKLDPRVPDDCSPEGALELAAEIRLKQ